MYVIKKIEDLAKYKNIINEKVKKENFQFTYENLYALHKANNSIFTFIKNVGKDVMITSFKIGRENSYECCMDREPIYGLNDEKKLIKFLEEIKKYIGADTLYFPLIYENSLFYKLANRNLMFIKYKRLYTSIIETNKVDLKRNFLDNNRINRFKKNCYIEYINGKDCKEIISKIEESSWKHNVGQDMLTKKDKFIYYNEIISQGIAWLVVARKLENDEPIAYRIEVIENGNLIFLKTSFDSKFEKLSAGTFLATYDLLHHYLSIENIKSIDLYGGPSIWKAFEETSRINRYDFCLGNEYTINKIRENRINWDKKNYEIFLERKSQKKIYKEFL